MFGRNKPDAILIARVLTAMEDQEPASKEYNDLLRVYERLTAVSKPKRQPVSMNTVMTVGGQLVGVFLIIAYEQKHVWTSKASSMLPKIKDDPKS